MRVYQSKRAAKQDDEASMYGYFASFRVKKDLLFAEISKCKEFESKSHLDAAKNVGITRDDEGSDHAMNFLDLFEAELDRVSETISSQQELQEFSAKTFLTNVESVVKAEPTEEALLNLRCQAEDMAEGALKLQHFTKNSTENLIEVAKFADSELKTATLKKLNRRFSAAPWKEGSNSALIVVMSDIFATIRDVEETSDKWVAPTSFERTTTKYWVHEDNLTDLLLAATKEAPLLVYGRTGKLTRKSDLKQAEGDKLWDSLATPVSSVYFDSPNMSMYKERLNRSEGAQLFRIRWYGTKPSGDEPVFLELKTHHEKWINEKSVKERCVIRERDMRKFLTNQNWTTEVAKELVLGGTPNIRGEQLEKQIELCEAMHDIVVSNNLRPTVRSTYNRAAFQSPGNNRLRLTFDRKVTLIDETSASPGSWCLSDNVVIDEEMVSHVPYLIFEIKLSGSEMPKVFQELQERGIIIEAPKFSKYLTGAASFNVQKLDSLPYWASDPAFEDSFHQRKKQSVGMISEKAKQVSIRRNINSATIGNASGFEDVSKMIQKCDKEEDISSSVTTSVTTSVTKRCSIDSEDSTMNNSNLRKRKSSERDMPEGTQKSTQGKHPSVRPKQPVRVEPKSFFANERTFIQWISAALMLVTISAILFRDLQILGNVPTTAGIILNVVAVFVMFYSMYVYYHRVKLLVAGSPYGYIDHVGPLILALAVLLGICILLFYYIQYAKSTNLLAGEAGLPVLTHESGSCFQRPLNGDLNLFQYEPSGVVVEEERGLILVPSLQSITGLDATSPEAPVQTLIRIPEADLEGMTMVGDRIFAISEGSQEPVLIELEWGMNERLVEVNSWELKTMQKNPNGQAEGIAYVPDSSGGSLYIAGDNLDPLDPLPEGRGVIYIFDVPEKDNNENSLTRRSTLNVNMLNKDLTDSKIGDLHYFEGVLYVLNDNDRVIRSWNIKTGELLATTQLPRVPGNFNRQWEGMALERASGNNMRLGRNMQGGPVYSLALHLTLDTPPQVWSIGVNQLEDIPGSLVLPACAGAN